MITLYDVAYGLGIGLTAPFWLLKSNARKKVLKAFSQRGGYVSARPGSGPAVMIHAVSLGEVNATRALIEGLRRRLAGLQFILSTTTDTGSSRAAELYGASADVMLIRYPLDFSPAVDRVLNAVRPSVVVLIELEVWPNFINRCSKRGIPVLLINGRLTTRSFQRYKLARLLVGRMFRSLHKVCVQDSTYAKRFTALGARPGTVMVTGTMKFDTAQVSDRINGQDELANGVGLRVGEGKIWVCGSTGPGEEQIILEEYLRLLERFAGLRLVIVPRKPERFEEVAGMIAGAGFGLVRASQVAKHRPQPAQAETDNDLPVIVLGDTIGDLRKFYALADVVFVGRTLLDLGARQHGSDMIEPAALAKPVIVGPFTANFAEATEKLIADKAILVAQNGTELREALAEMLDMPAEGMAMGRRARDVVKREQGATDRHADLIVDVLRESRKI